MSSIKKDYRDIILLIAIYIEIKNNITICRLVALSIKSANCNRQGEGINK